MSNNKLRSKFFTLYENNLKEENLFTSTDNISSEFDLIYKKYKDIGFEILGVSLDTEKALWLKAIKDDGLPWLHVSDLSRWENEVALKFKIKSAPSSFLINEDGVVIAKNLRGEELTKKLAEIFSSK